MDIYREMITRVFAITFLLALNASIIIKILVKKFSPRNQFFLAMGGNAFENTSRLTVPEFLRVQRLVKIELLKLGLIVECPPEVADKESFGDIDVYVADPIGKECNTKLSAV